MMHDFNFRPRLESCVDVLYLIYCTHNAMTTTTTKKTKKKKQKFAPRSQAVRWVMENLRGAPVPRRYREALKCFAEDVYHCSAEYGPEDVRTSLGYYNLSKIFQGVGDIERSLSCNATVVNIWMEATVSRVLGAALSARLRKTRTSSAGEGHLPLGRSQLLEVVDMLEDIRSLRMEALGERHPSVRGRDSSLLHCSPQGGMGEGGGV